MENSLAIFNEKTSNRSYCSIKPDTDEDKIKIFNSLGNCDYVLNECEGKVIKLKDVYIAEYDTKDKETGEPRKGHRTVLFDENGQTYITLSNYFAYSLLQLLNTFGDPTTWEKPLLIQITKKQNGNQKGASLGFKLVKEDTVEA